MAYSEAMLAHAEREQCSVSVKEGRKGRRMKGEGEGRAQKIPTEQQLCWEFVCGLWANETEMPLLGTGARLRAAPS